MLLLLDLERKILKLIPSDGLHVEQQSEQPIQVSHLEISNPDELNLKPSRALLSRRETKPKAVVRRTRITEFALQMKRLQEGERRDLQSVEILNASKVIDHGLNSPATGAPARYSRYWWGKFDELIPGLQIYHSIHCDSYHPASQDE